MHAQGHVQVVFRMSVDAIYRRCRCDDSNTQRDL
jgi:hypothetical protein